MKKKGIFIKVSSFLNIFIVLYLANVHVGLHNIYTSIAHFNQAKKETAQIESRSTHCLQVTNRNSIS